MDDSGEEMRLELEEDPAEPAADSSDGPAGDPSVNHDGAEAERDGPPADHDGPSDHGDGPSESGHGPSDRGNGTLANDDGLPSDVEDPSNHGDGSTVDRDHPSDKCDDPSGECVNSTGDDKGPSDSCDGLTGDDKGLSNQDIVTPTNPGHNDDSPRDCEDPSGDGEPEKCDGPTDQGDGPSDDHDNIGRNVDSSSADHDGSSRNIDDSSADYDGPSTSDDGPHDAVECLESAEAADTAEVAEEARLRRLTCAPPADAEAADEERRRREAAALTEALQEGVSVHSVAKKYGMPRSTLYGRVERYRYLQSQLAKSAAENPPPTPVQDKPIRSSSRRSSRSMSSSDTASPRTPRRSRAQPLAADSSTPAQPSLSVRPAAAVPNSSAQRPKKKEYPSSWPDLAVLISRRLAVSLDEVEAYDRAIVSVLAGRASAEEAAAEVGCSPMWIVAQTKRYRREPSRFQFRRRFSGADSCYLPDSATTDTDQPFSDADSDDSGGGPWHGFPLEVKLACEAAAPADGGVEPLPLLDALVARGSVHGWGVSDGSDTPRAAECGKRQSDDQPGSSSPCPSPVQDRIGGSATEPRVGETTGPGDGKTDQHEDTAPESPLQPAGSPVPPVESLSPVESPAPAESPTRADSPTHVESTSPADNSPEFSSAPAENNATVASPRPAEKSSHHSSPFDNSSSADKPLPQESLQKSIGSPSPPTELVDSSRASSAPKESPRASPEPYESPRASPEPLESPQASDEPFKGLLPADEPAEELSSRAEPGKSSQDSTEPVEPAEISRTTAEATESPEATAKAVESQQACTEPSENPQVAEQTSESAEGHQAAESAKSSESPPQPTESVGSRPDSVGGAGDNGSLTSPTGSQSDAGGTPERRTTRSRKRAESERSSGRRDRSDESDGRSQDRKKKKKKKHHSSDREDGSRRRSKDRKKKKKKRRSSSHEKERQGRSRHKKHRDHESVDELILKTKRRESLRLAKEKQSRQTELQQSRPVEPESKDDQAAKTTPFADSNVRDTSNTVPAVSSPKTDKEKTESEPVAVIDKSTAEAVENEEAAVDGSLEDNQSPGKPSAGSPHKSNADEVGKLIKGAVESEEAAKDKALEDNLSPAKPSADSPEESKENENESVASTANDGGQGPPAEASQDKTQPSKNGVSGEEAAPLTKEEEATLFADSGATATSSEEPLPVTKHDEALYAWLIGHMGSKKAAEKFHVCRKHLRGRRDTMTRDQRISFLKRMRDFYQVRDAGKTKTPAAAPAQRSRPPSTRPSKPRPSFGEALMLPETAMISPPRRRAETDSPQPSGDPASRLLSEAEVCVVLDELRAGQSTTAITGRYKITRNWLTRFSDEYAAGRSDKDIYQLYVRTASARTDQDNIARAVALVLKGHSVKKIARQSNLGVNVLNYHIKKHRERQAATGGAGDQAKPTGEVAAAAGAPEARPERLTKTALRHLIRKLMDCAETDVSGKAELESQLALPQRHVNRLLQMASRKGTAPAAVFSLYCRLWREAGDEKATTTSSRKDSLAASVLAHGPGGDGPGAVRDGPPGSKDEPVAESGPAAKDAPATDANKPASKKDEPAVKDDSGDPGAAATAPADGTPSGDTPGRSRRQRRPPKHLEGYLDVAVPSPERPAAPAEPAVADLCARAESAARAAFAVERGVCLPSEAPARFKVTPEELAEASRALGNMPLIKKKLNTLGMRRAVAAVLRGHTQQWAVSMCKVTPMGLWKTLKRLRQAGLIGQHIGKRRFIGGDSEPAPSKDDSADGTADETSQEAPMEDASSAATADDSDDSDTEQQVSDDEVPMGDSLDLSNLEPNMLAAVKAVLSGDSKALAAKKYRVERKDLIETLRKRAVTPIGVLGSSEFQLRVDGSASLSQPVREAINAVTSGKMSRAAAAAHYGVSVKYLYNLIINKKKKRQPTRETLPLKTAADSRLDRIRAALAEARKGKESRAAIAKKYGMSYFTFYYYWKRQQEGKPLPSSSRLRSTKATVPDRPPPATPPSEQPASPAVDPSSISDVMRKAIGSVILGKMCVKAASTLHRVPFGQLKSLCQSMTARYDSKGAVVVEAASEVPPPQSTSVAASPAQPQAPTSPAPSPAGAGVSVDEASLLRLKPNMQAAVRAVLSGESRIEAAYKHHVNRSSLGQHLLKMGVRCRTLSHTPTSGPGASRQQSKESETGSGVKEVSKTAKTEPQTEPETNPQAGQPAGTEPAKSGSTPSTVDEKRLAGLKPQMAAAVRAVLAGSSREEAAEAHGVYSGKLLRVLRCRDLITPAVSKLTLTRTPAGYQVSRAVATGSSGKDGLPLREAVERVLLLGEQAKDVASSESLDAKLLEKHCLRRPAPEPHFHAVRDEIPVMYAAMALCDQGWDINTDSLRWMFEQFLEKSGQSVPPADSDWLSLETLYCRWPEVRDQICTDPGKPTAEFEAAFLQALHTVCDELELKLGEVVLHDAESARRRRTREVLPLPVAAEPPPGHIWDNRNGTWILEKDGKQQAFFEVDTILARREAATDGSQPEYLIRWKGYTDAWNTWEPEGNLECTDTLAAFQRRWDTVAEEERRRIIAEFSPVAPAPGLAPAAAAAATPAAQQRKGRPPKMGQQTLDSMAAARQVKAEKSVSKLRVRTDLMSSTSSPATTSPATAATPAATPTATPSAASTESVEPSPSADETRSRRSTKARANALFKQWLVSPKLATKKAVQESLADTAPAAGVDDRPPPGIPATPSPSVSTKTSASTSASATSATKGRYRPNLSVSRALSGSSRGGQRRIDEFVRRGSSGGARLGRAPSPPPQKVPQVTPPSDAASEDSEKGRPERRTSTERSRPPPVPVEKEIIESETERLRKLDEELRLLDEEEAAAGAGAEPVDDGAVDGDTDEGEDEASPVETGETVSKDPEEANVSKRADVEERVETITGESATDEDNRHTRSSRRVSESESRTSKEADKRRISGNVERVEKEKVVEKDGDQEKSETDATAAAGSETKRRTRRDSERERRASIDARNERRVSRSAASEEVPSEGAESKEAGSTKADKEMKPSGEAGKKRKASEDNEKVVPEEVRGKRRASKEVLSERKVSVDLEKSKEKADKELERKEVSKKVEIERKVSKEPEVSGKTEKEAVGEKRPAKDTSNIESDTIKTKDVATPPRKEKPVPDSIPTPAAASVTVQQPVVVIKRGRGRPPKSPEKRALQEARLAALAASPAAANRPKPARLSLPLDDDAPLSKRRRPSAADEPQTPTPDSAVGKRQRKVPKRFLDGETLLWGETPLSLMASHPTDDGVDSDPSPAASRPSKPSPASQPPASKPAPRPAAAEPDSPRPITFEPPSKRKPIVFVSPIRKDGSTPASASVGSTARRLDLDSSQAGQATKRKIIIRTVGKPLKPAPKAPSPDPPMMILDESADVVIEDGPVIIDESGQLVPARSVPAPEPTPPPPPPASAPVKTVVVTVPPPTPTTPAPDVPVKRRRGRPPKIRLPDGSTPVSSPSAAKTTAASLPPGKTPPPGKKRGRKPKPKPEPEPEPVPEEVEEPEEVTLDLSSLVDPLAGADLDADVGYFDVNGQFVERSPVKADWSAGGAHFGLDAAVGGDPGVLDSSLVLVHPDPQLDGLCIGGEAI
ncbi:uncharacterized protein LOC122369662 [Amphibalanus amphitrite]|uniref:uncharacterized protein LOC122369662 n=1 Tax=Amphibalanus amphitrite TaxID=1232801 RepID=UPI001C92B189|nr:uncharacterized protein LOC122369662 [Amphibalanus amphitrite]